MLTSTEEKFKRVVKEIYHHSLKPLGYLKKANNFYCAGEVGKIVNLQKSIFYSKDFTKFTVNVGIFSPLYWNAYYTYPNKVLPAYPTEPECVLRSRIGHLKGGGDVWFEISEDTDIDTLLATQAQLFDQFMLPYLNRINSHQDVINELYRGNSARASIVAKLVLLAELGRLDEAFEEYKRLLDDVRFKSRRENIIEVGQRYGLDKARFL